ncbi:MAG: type II toxin-antitoxin system VapB family antitoxin [Candidatus Sabulitectum sp.]|nr:type II toxin-antitoxin system VapB family antitoxin [Candidatus Sabulitectum sp.]
MSRTNIVLDDELVDECKELTGIKTRRALIDYALQELRRIARQRRLMELKGSVDWEGDLAVWRKERVL